MYNTAKVAIKRQVERMVWRYDTVSPRHGQFDVPIQAAYSHRFNNSLYYVVLDNYITK